MRIYISGPITGTQDHQERFEAASRYIEARGDVPVNPEPLGRILPDGTRSEYMLLCMKLLELSDAIYMLEGWEKSQGAKSENFSAKRMRFPVFFEKGGSR